MTPLSHSLEDYIEAIYIIGLRKNVVRVKDVAHFLDVKMPSVVDAISKLSERELVSHEKYGYLNLTKKGFDTAKKIYRKHEEVYGFLYNFLGMDKETAEKDACEIEHYISKSTLDKIIRLMRFIDSKPEGYPEWLKRFRNFESVK
ncbi:MAG: metal-dependent transcriptional regulator [Actinobacteria bacterium]|nr:metal-dependent transcriptional regulator [Actinomycetota bacterium]